MPVSQNIRRAIEALDNLEHLMLGLNKDPRVSANAQQLKAALTDVLEELKRFIDGAYEGGAAAAEGALQQEGSARSQGQQARQARIDSCDTPA